VNYVGILTTSDTDYKHTGLVPGRTYYYRIMADSCESSPLSSSVSATYRTAAGVPYTLSGTITVNGAAMDPAATATVRAVEVTGANQGNSAAVDPDGSYRMALFPGTYNISVDCWFGESWHGIWINFGSWGYPGHQNLTIGADTARSIDIPLHALTGTVKDGGGNPVAAVDLSYSQGSTTTSAEAGFEGAYKLYFLPGTYDLQVSAPPALFPPFEVERLNIAGDSSRDIVLGFDHTILDAARAMMAPDLELHLDISDFISIGATNVYNLAVPANRDLVQLIVNWPGSEIELSVYRPDGTLYGRYQSAEPPIVVSIPNPVTGTWGSEVTAVDIPYDNYPIAVVAGITPNQPPVADVVGPYFGTAGTPVVLNAGGSHDADGEIVLYEWDWDDDGVFDESTTQAGVTHSWLQSYDGTLRLRVTDSQGLLDIACASVVVMDAAPPDITLSAGPDTLWPPNHKMVPVAVAVSGFGPTDKPVCYITSVSSNEPEDGPGDGDTAPDWEITGDLTVKLRAERSGTGNGRIYTIAIECTGAAGNSTIATAEVSVPHDLGKKKGKK
jgi:hypothetical protein